LSVDNGPAICILYKKCDLDKKARMPARPGKTYKLKSSEFYFESRGSLRCAMGKAIMDEKTCKEACKALNVPQIQILGDHLCYKDSQGKCYQNGENGAGASLICKKYDDKAEWKVIAKSEPTCIGGENKIVEKKGLTLEKCKELANSDKTANFIWFAVQKMPNSNPSVCHLYKKCDLKEKARYPERPGRTLEKKSTSDA